MERTPLHTRTHTHTYTHTHTRPTYLVTLAEIKNKFVKKKIENVLYLLTIMSLNLACLRSLDCFVSRGAVALAGEPVA